MNILFVHKYCGFKGGIEQNLYETVKGLQSAGHNCSLYFEERLPLRNEEFSAPFERCIDARDTGEKERVIRVEDFDMIYVHKWDDLRFLEKLCPGTPRAIMVHDHDYYCPRKHNYTTFTKSNCETKLGLPCILDLAFVKKDSQGKLAYQSISKCKRNLNSLNSFDAIHVYSEFIRQRLITNSVNPGIIEVLSPGVQLINPVIPKKSKIPEILYVGQLIRGKGVDLLLRSLAKSNMNFKVNIIGDGNDRANLEELSRHLNLDSKVSFHGYLKKSQINEYYSRSSLVVVPSRWSEPFGLVGLEAMQAGLPVVGFDNGGIKEWLSDQKNGFLVEPGNLNEFLYGVEKLLADNELAKSMGEEGKRMFHEQFRFENYLERLVQSFRDIQQADQVQRFEMSA